MITKIYHFFRQFITIIISEYLILVFSIFSMDLGTSIALFLALAIGLMILFCLVTRYFQYRVNKKMQEQQMGQVYSQVDQITQNSQQDIDGQYQQFLDKRKLSAEQKKKNLAKGKAKQDDYLFQTTQIQSPMKSNTDPIYGVSMLKKRLDGEVLPMKQQTGRSMHSAKSFRPERLQNGASSLSSQRTGLLGIQAPVPLIVHQFISKLIAYNEQGLLILTINLSSIRKQNGKMKQKKSSSISKISPLEEGFEDQLQVLGFENKQYSCCKFKTRVQIPNMVQNQDYNLSSLKTSQGKQQIDFSQYYMLKDKIQEQSK